MSRAIVLFSLCSLSSLAACADAPLEAAPADTAALERLGGGPTGGPCANDLDCQGNAVCHLGTCLRPCLSDADCQHLASECAGDTCACIDGECWAY
ncbi:MAG: hypothetical protein R3F59_08585 [Myxococcota bacterium]